MSKYNEIITELKLDESEVIKLWQLVSKGEAKVKLQLPGEIARDITTEYAEGMRKAADGLNKAICALKKVED